MPPLPLPGLCCSRPLVSQRAVCAAVRLFPMAPPSSQLWPACQPPVHTQKSTCCPCAPPASPTTRSTFINNRETAVDFLNAVDRVYIVDAYANWDPKYRAKIRVITTRAYHALFMHVSACFFACAARARLRLRLPFAAVSHAWLQPVCVCVQETCLCTWSGPCPVPTDPNPATPPLTRPWPAQNMLIRPTAEELANFGEPDFVIYNAGGWLFTWCCC